MSTLAAPPPAAVSDAAAVSLLREVVETESLSGQEQAVARVFAKHMAAMGMKAHIDAAGNAVGELRGPGPVRAEMVLLGHMDTAPGRVPVRVEGDLLYGRGSVDAKGPLAAFVAAAAGVGLSPGIRLLVVGAVEEEAATSKGAHHALREYSPRACIIGEPSSWDGVTLGYKGRVLTTYRVQRPCSHSAGPDATAGDVMHSWWSRVRGEVDSMNAGRFGIFDQVQAGLRSISTHSDGLHEVGHAIAGFRIPPGVEVADIERLCRDAARGGELSFEGAERVYVADRNNMLARAFSGAIRAEGGRPAPRVKTGTSDMNVVGPVWGPKGCAIVAYGPGDSTLDHTPDEHLSISEFLRSIRVLRRVIGRVASELSAG